MPVGEQLLCFADAANLIFKRQSNNLPTAAHPTFCL